MKLLFTGISVLLLLLAIASFVAAFAYLWPVLEFTLPGSTPATKEAVGTVTDISISLSSSRSASTGRTSSTSHERATIQFRDENGNLFKTSCEPVFMRFKRNDKVNMLYCASSVDLQEANENKTYAIQHNSSIRPVSLSGIPKSLFYWLERPIIFSIIGIVLLILRIPAGLFKNTFQ